VFVKGGSIVPILLHDDCMSLLSCINNPLRLEVYPDGDGYAESLLYLDDGESMDYKFDDNHAWINMTW
jgi:alpha-glucosidase (family GH31 glycosyl hydrolase)